MSTITEAEFAALDVLCLAKLKPVSFGLQNSCDRIVRGIEFAVDKKRPVSWKQRTAMYQICYRFRKQIGDLKFIARVMIAKAEADPFAENERRQESRPGKIRAWAAENPFNLAVGTEGKLL